MRKVAVSFSIGFVKFAGIEQERASGWSGVMTLPRILSLATDSSLLIEPVPELEMPTDKPQRREKYYAGYRW